MRIATLTTRARVGAALALVLATCAGAQDASPSLGDVARKSRRERAAIDHTAAKPASDDEGGPDASGVWRVRHCQQNPCFELSVTLPASSKWTRSTEEPRPVLIPLPGFEEESSRAIRVYAAEAIPPSYAYDGSTRTFVQGWFARPEYFGQAARNIQETNTVIEGGRGAMIAHFTVIGGSLKYRGVSLVAATNYGSFGFACVFREEDAGAAASICDAIIASANAQTLQPAQPHFYPHYSTPYPTPYYPQLDPRQPRPEGYDYDPEDE